MPSVTVDGRFDTIQQVIEENSQRFKDNIAYQILEGKQTYRTCTYHQVYTAAKSIAGFLNREKVPAQQAVGKGGCKWRVAVLYELSGIVFSTTAAPQASPKQLTAVRKRSRSQSTLRIR